MEGERAVGAVNLAYVGLEGVRQQVTLPYDIF